ncbi:MAG: hypothetical protein DRR16_15325 [Candidatus Parabeggiatoa sp. nov. 3]|jgi:hypothetical protein|nr:MAG: hypothetical protein DRR00_16410 [Gammaproteobacteria bacterium]RKZ68673.1 MAG: hypothetical protein DRQ99_03175 [Gammaproteobacteria bacterium]RKZ84207.1 MAG: hypothetical protein DRR16_15325 [Gammaproteobacteria bacterium]
MLKKGLNDGQEWWASGRWVFDRTLIVLIVMINADLIINQFKSNNPLPKKKADSFAFAESALIPVNPLMRASLMRSGAYLII